MVKKAQFFRNVSAKIFDPLPGFRFVQNESVMKGFFFLFVYKDFVLRDVIELMNEVLRPKVALLLAQIEREYLAFIEGELVEWVSLMLAMGVFQSHSSVVSPNQANYQEFKSRQDGSKIILPASEGQNYFSLQKRYMKLYMKGMNLCNASRKRNYTRLELIDSELDDNSSEFDDLFSQDKDSIEDRFLAERLSAQDSDDDDDIGYDIKTIEQKLEF